MMDMDMAMVWMAWMEAYGYMDGIDRDSLDADSIRMMARDYMDGCDEWDAEYDSDITSDMVVWARR